MVYLEFVYLPAKIGFFREIGKRVIKVIFIRMDLYIFEKNSKFAL